MRIISILLLALLGVVSLSVIISAEKEERDYCQFLGSISLEDNTFLYTCPNSTFVLRRFSRTSDHYVEIYLRLSHIVRLVEHLLHHQYEKNAPSPRFQSTFDSNSGRHPTENDPR